jgi:hypothetical protein
VLSLTHRASAPAKTPAAEAVIARGQVRQTSESSQFGRNGVSLGLGGQGRVGLSLARSVTPVRRPALGRPLARVHDEHQRLVGVLVTNSDNAQRPVPEQDPPLCANGGPHCRSFLSNGPLTSTRGRKRLSRLGERASGSHLRQGEGRADDETHPRGPVAACVAAACRPDCSSSRNCSASSS